MRTTEAGEGRVEYSIILSTFGLPNRFKGRTKLLLFEGGGARFGSSVKEADKGLSSPVVCALGIEKERMDGCRLSWLAGIRSNNNNNNERIR